MSGSISGLGNEVTVSHRYVPTLWDAGKHGSTNSFMGMFASIDVVFIFEAILSLPRTNLSPTMPLLENMNVGPYV